MVGMMLKQTLTDEFTGYVEINKPRTTVSWHEHKLKNPFVYAFTFVFFKKHSIYPFGYKLLIVKKHRSHHLFAAVTQFLGSRVLLFMQLHCSLNNAITWTIFFFSVLNFLTVFFKKTLYCDMNNIFFSKNWYKVN